MIIKIKSHKKPSFTKLLEYMLNNEDRLFDEKGKSFLVTHNLKGRSIKKWVEQFNANETFRKIRRKDSVYLTHEILSWHKDDTKHLTLEKIEDMTREYMRRRNPLGLFVAVPHYDKSHLHVHICASGIEYRTGKSMRLTKLQLTSLKKGIQGYEIESYPELSKSLVRHGEKEIGSKTEIEYQFKLRTGRETDKFQLIKMLNIVYKKANSRKAFFSILNDFDIKTYFRSGKIAGVVYNKRKYRFKSLGLGELIVKLDKTNELRELRERQRKSNERGIRR